MSDMEAVPAQRRRGRPAGATNRRPRINGAQLMATLNEQVTELINENRRLKREVVRLTSGEASAGANGAGEKTLRSLQRKVQRAVEAVPVATRRTTGASRRRRPAGESAAD